MGLQSSQRRAGALTVAPLTTALGAEISGVDLAVPLTDAVIAEIRAALLDHCVIFFRDQQLDVAQKNGAVGTTMRGSSRSAKRAPLMVHVPGQN